LRSSYKNGDDDRGRLLQYEAQHPPLYYLLLTIPYLAVSHLPVPAQALILRFASLLISAAGILLCFKLASQVPACRRAAIPTLLLLASWPGLLVSMSRIANDGLALAIGSAVVLSLFRVVRRGSGMRDWLLVGAALGAGLLTKAYLLALLPVLPLTALLAVLRRRATPARAVSGCLLVSH
jgi:4-amino-4-deoxy-L-arabinose transferase-like glycosyltransferase